MKNVYRGFNVVPGIHGFKVVIGCSELYFGSAEALHRALTRYLDDPQGTEKRFMEDDIRYGTLTPATAAIQEDYGRPATLTEQMSREAPLAPPYVGDAIRQE